MKDVEKSPKSRAVARQRDCIQALTASGAGAPDFTPAQWRWLKARTREFEKDYRATHTLIAGL